MKKIETNNNVDFDYYCIKNVNKKYVLESNNVKRIDITRMYTMNGTKTVKSDLYDICYDGVTDLFCNINLVNNNLAIDFKGGESIHGTSNVYELDYESNKQLIESIISDIKGDKNFLDFCKAKTFFNNLNRYDKCQLIKEYGENADKGYILSTTEYSDLITIQKIDELYAKQNIDFDYNDILAVNLARDNKVFCIDIDIGININGTHIANNELNIILENMVDTYKNQIVLNTENINIIKDYCIKTEILKQINENEIERYEEIML